MYSYRLIKIDPSTTNKAQLEPGDHGLTGTPSVVIESRCDGFLIVVRSNQRGNAGATTPGRLAATDVSSQRLDIHSLVKNICDEDLFSSNNNLHVHNAFSITSPMVN